MSNPNAGATEPRRHDRAHDARDTPDPRDAHAPIRILVAHDQRMLAEGLRMALDTEFDLEVVAITATREATIMEAGVVEPDVAIIDLALADGGIGVGEALKRALPGVKVLLLTGNAEPDTFIADAIGSGFDGFLHKHASIFETVHAVHVVHEGGSVFAPHELTMAVQAARRGTGHAAPTELTERESEILQLVAEGLSTAKIAARLYLSPHTVRSHVGHILAKLDTHSKGEAVAVGYRRGLITLR